MCQDEIAISTTRKLSLRKPQMGKTAIKELLLIFVSHTKTLKKGRERDRHRKMSYKERRKRQTNKRQIQGELLDETKCLSFQMMWTDRQRYTNNKTEKKKKDKHAEKKDRQRNERHIKKRGQTSK